MAIQELRNCPMSNGPSPASVFFKRNLRGTLPVLKKQVNTDETDKQRQERRLKYLTSKKGVQYDTLEVGQPVWIVDRSTNRWNVKGYIDKVRSHRRSYWVVTEGGLRILRNRIFLKKRFIDVADIDRETAAGGIADTAIVSGDQVTTPHQRRQSPRLQAKRNLLGEHVRDVKARRPACHDQYRARV